MKRVATISIPHNFRDEIYDPDDGPSFREDYEPDERRQLSARGTDWATLPIPMPQHLMTFTDRDGRVIAAHADGKRIRWADLDIVVTGVQQYNADLVWQGRHEPIDDIPDAAG